MRCETGGRLLRPCSRYGVVVGVDVVTLLDGPGLRHTLPLQPVRTPRTRPMTVPLTPLHPCPVPGSVLGRRSGVHRGPLGLHAMHRPYVPLLRDPALNEDEDYVKDTVLKDAPLGAHWADERLYA